MSASSLLSSGLDAATSMLGLSAYPPTSFCFAVNIVAASAGGVLGAVLDTSFQEVSGMDWQTDIEEYNEGGENRFVHQLPKGIKQQKLSLKRGVAGVTSPLMLWCKGVMEGGLNTSISPRIALVHLLNEHRLPMRVWCFHNAYPVHWEIEPFSSLKNEVAIERIELAYQYCTRVL